jgi:hypothetical protein
MLSAWLSGRKLRKAFSAHAAKNYEQAYTLFTELAAKKVTSGFYFLGEYNLYGLHVPKDLNKALLYFEQAATAFYVDVNFMAGWCAEQLNDIQATKKWYEIACKYNDKRAFYRLGKLYLEGKLFPKDLAQAEAVFILGNDKYCNLKLGELYLETNNKKQAIHFLKMADAQGLNDAKIKLGSINE